MNAAAIQKRDLTGLCRVMRSYKNHTRGASTASGRVRYARALTTPRNRQTLGGESAFNQSSSAPASKAMAGNCERLAVASWRNNGFRANTLAATPAASTDPVLLRAANHIKG